MYTFFCDEDVEQYYGENYAVMVGTSDLQIMNDNACAMIQGNTRYDRAKNFYAFCDSNAVNRGLNLQWQYAEVPGIGHDEFGLYNTKALPTDSSSIFETMLFDTPHHQVPSVAPVSGFYADTVFVNVNDTVFFTNTSYNSSTYLWDFGDTTTSTQINPYHIYHYPGRYTVQLNSTNTNACTAWNEIRHYINVLSSTGITEHNSQNKKFKIVPNPAKGKIELFFTEANFLNALVSIYDLSGRKILEKNTTVFDNKLEINIEAISSGSYSIHVQSGNEIYKEVFVVIK